MRAVVQRVKEATVVVDGREVGRISRGVLVYLGVGRNDGEKDARAISDKVAALRIFADEQGKMNLSVKDVGGQALVVSQFTLLGDARDGRRPSYIEAAPPEKARELYERVIALLSQEGLTVATGQFQAMMEVRYTNEGPVTILLDSEKRF